MARIRAKDTQPEIKVRKLVFAIGRRYRLHNRLLPGCPDLVFTRDRKVIFVHGCFWHPHPGCKIARMPRSRLSYWVPKLEGNSKRDRKNTRLLRGAGWKVLTVRECELGNLKQLSHRLRNFLCGLPEDRRSAGRSIAN